MIESADIALQVVNAPGGATRAATSRIAETRSFRRGFSWLIVGNFVFAACQWANLSVLAKLGSSVDVGRFALALAVTTPVFMLTNLQLRGIQATDVRRQFSFRLYSALRLLTSGLAVLMVLAIAGLLDYSTALVAVVLAVSAGKFADSLNDLTFGLAQFHEHFSAVALGRMLAGVASLVGLSLGVVLGHDVVWGAVGWAAGHATTALLTPLWLGRNVLELEAEQCGATDTSESAWQTLIPLWDWRGLWHLTRLALPMGIVMMLVSTNLNAPRYFVQEHLGESQLGIYAAMSYLLVAGHMFVLALGQAAIPRLAKSFARGDLSAFRGLLWRLIGLGTACAGAGLLLAIFAGKPLLTLLYTAEYAAYPDVLICLIAVAALDFACTFLGEAMTAARQFRVQVPLFIAVLAGTALACSLLIPRWGLLGAALATGCGSLIQLIGSLVVLRFAVRQRMEVST